jgi:hypothetical protein
MTRTYNVLTEDEKFWLRKVDTTPAEAWQIRERNLALLSILDRIEAGEDLLCYEHRVDIGCPHCNYGLDCEFGCRWHVDGSPWRDLDDPSRLMDCIRATFGGIPLVSWDGSPCAKHVVTLHRDAAAIKERHVGYGRTDEEDAAMRAWARTFLEGHVEWAEDILDDDGITVRELSSTRGLGACRRIGWIAAPSAADAWTLRRCIKWAGSIERMPQPPAGMRIGETFSIRGTKVRAPFSVEPMRWFAGDWREQDWAKCAERL